MKNFKTIVAGIAISLSTVFFASAANLNPNKTDETKTLRTEISSFIGKNIPIELDKATIVKISFIVNNENEIVVLSVDSNLSELDYLLKRKLNYKKITVKGVKKGVIYRMPIKIKIN
jgi:hypothetical protein